jgi:RNA polymerase sigma factor (sigma-70 family)
VRVQGIEDDRRSGFETAYRELYSPICGYALRRVSDPEDAAEVVAESFLTLWRRWDEAPKGAALRPWLYGVARRIAANQRRGTVRRTALAMRLTQDFRTTLATIPPPDEGTASEGSLRRAFAALSDSDRELLALVAWEGLTPSELATALGVSGPVARLRLHRARRRLAAHLDRDPAMQQIGGTGHVPLRQATAGPSDRKGHA